MSTGRRDPVGSTATSYAWFIWLRDDDGGADRAETATLDPARRC